VALAALFSFNFSLRMEVIAYQSPEYFEMLALRYKILRQPLGLNFSEADLQQEKDDVFIACCQNGSIAGCCILTRLSDEVVKFRQMAVDDHCQGKNVGTSILQFSERYAAEQGYTVVKLHARKTACMFYAKNGYVAAGDEFIEVGIPHVYMEKNL